MTTLFDLKPEIERGAKIRRKCWKPLKTYTGNYTLSKDELFADDWEAVFDQEATKQDIGKLCWFWDGLYEKECLGILDKIYPPQWQTRFADRITDCSYRNCRRLTPSEVAEITGYKVEEEE